MAPGGCPTVGRVSVAGSTSPRVRVHDVTAFRRPIRLRMPFQLGRITIESLDAVYVRVEGDCDGERIVGVGASTLSPLWFDKSPERNHDDKSRALLTSIALAVDGYRRAGEGTPWELHRVVQPAVRAACSERGVPELTSSFGVALIDGAMVDALCRRYEASFHAALRHDLFGFGEVPGLPTRPRTDLPIRHTIGLADPLTAGEVEDPLNDGLPETLEDVVREYGVRFFKIKIGADADANLARLAAIQRVLHEVAPADHRVVLDGNESCTDFDGFVPFAERLAGDPDVRDLYDRLLWIEQPVAREASLLDGVAPQIRYVSTFRPLILDESDATDETVEEALRAGYAGVSAKNCKGVFRTLHASRVLHGQQGSILSAEDLTLPSVDPLHQDLAVISALGVHHAERNGHHYVRGLSHLSQGEQQLTLRDYPSLYETSSGLVRMRIRAGGIDVSEVAAAPYGVVSPPDLSSMCSIDLAQLP